MVALPPGGRGPQRDPETLSVTFAAVPRHLNETGHAVIPKEPSNVPWPLRARALFWDGEQLVEAVRKELRAELRAAFTRAGLVPPAEEPEPDARDGELAVLVLALAEGLANVAREVRQVVSSGTVPAGREALLDIARRADEVAQVVKDPAHHEILERNATEEERK